MMQYAWTSAHMPVLSGIIRKNVKAKPLLGIKLGFCLQLTAETAVILGAKALGAKVYASSGNPLTTNDAIAYLDSTGVDVYGRPSHKMHDLVRKDANNFLEVLKRPLRVCADQWHITGSIFALQTYKKNV